MQIFGNFIRKYCYASLYCPKHPEKIKSGINFISLELNKNDYFLGLFELMRSEEEHFINVQHVFFKHLNLPYDKSIVDDIEENYEGSFEWKNIDFALDFNNKQIAGLSNLAQFIKEILDIEGIVKFY